MTSLSDSERRERQYEMYQDLLQFVNTRIHDSGSHELTIADFQDCDKTAVYVVCPLIYIKDLELDHLLEQLRRFPTYDHTQMQLDEHGNIVPFIYVCWNVVEEEEYTPVKNNYERGPPRPRPPPAWQAVASVLGLLSTALFAAVKEPLFGLV